MTDREIFQRNLNYYLEKYDKTQAELVKYTGSSKQTVSGWVHGVSYPRIDMMEKIANFFGVKTTDIVSEHKMTEELTADEQELIRIFRKLSFGGKNSLMLQAQMHEQIFGEKYSAVQEAN